MLKKTIRTLLKRAGRRMPVMALRMEAEQYLGRVIGEAELDQALTDLVATREVEVDNDPDTGDRRVRMI